MYPSRTYTAHFPCRHCSTPPCGPASRPEPTPTDGANLCPTAALSPALHRVLSKGRRHHRTANPIPTSPSYSISSAHPFAPPTPQPTSTPGGFRLQPLTSLFAGRLFPIRDSPCGFAVTPQPTPTPGGCCLASRAADRKPASTPPLHRAYRTYPGGRALMPTPWPHPDLRPGSVRAINGPCGTNGPSGTVPGLHTPSPTCGCCPASRAAARKLLRSCRSAAWRL